jgi:hypothetical protein
LLVGGEPADGGSGPGALHHSQQSSTTTTVAYEIVADFLFVSAPQR